MRCLNEHGNPMVSGSCLQSGTFRLKRLQSSHMRPGLLAEFAKFDVLTQPGQPLSVFHRCLGTLAAKVLCERAQCFLQRFSAYTYALSRQRCER